MWRNPTFQRAFAGGFAVPHRTFLVEEQSSDQATPPAGTSSGRVPSGTVTSILKDVAQCRVVERRKKCWVLCSECSVRVVPARSASVAAVAWG